jgi:hypothetical protein
LGVGIEQGVVAHDMMIRSLGSIRDTETPSIMADFYRKLGVRVDTARPLCNAALAQLRARRNLNGAAHLVLLGGVCFVWQPRLRGQELSPHARKIVPGGQIRLILSGPRKT